MPVTTRPRRPAAAAPSSTVDRDLVAVIAACAVAFVATLALVGHTPGHVAGVTVHNPTDATVDVWVGRPGSGSHLPLVTLEPRTSARVEAVLDQGARWQFTYARAGRPVTHATVTRHHLADAGWGVTVPAATAGP
jgi:hypothetical protein